MRIGSMALLLALAPASAATAAPAGACSNEVVQDFARIVFLDTEPLSVTEGAGQLRVVGRGLTRSIAGGEAGVKVKAGQTGTGEWWAELVAEHDVFRYDGERVTVGPARGPVGQLQVVASPAILSRPSYSAWLEGDGHGRLLVLDRNPIGIHEDAYVRAPDGRIVEPDSGVGTLAIEAGGAGHVFVFERTDAPRWSSARTDEGRFVAELLFRGPSIEDPDEDCEPNIFTCMTTTLDGKWVILCYCGQYDPSGVCCWQWTGVYGKKALQ